MRSILELFGRVVLAPFALLACAAATVYWVWTGEVPRIPKLQFKRSKPMSGVHSASEQASKAHRS